MEGLLDLNHYQKVFDLNEDFWNNTNNKPLDLQDEDENVTVLKKFCFV